MPRASCRQLARPARELLLERRLYESFVEHCALAQRSAAPNPWFDVQNGSKIMNFMIFEIHEKPKTIKISGALLYLDLRLKPSDR